MNLIEKLDERGDFVTDVDGFVYFWPSKVEGHLAAFHLREIADELDRRNAAWNAKITAYFDGKAIIQGQSVQIGLEFEQITGRIVAM